MIKTIKKALLLRKFNKLPLVEMRDTAILSSIGHMVEDGCICLANSVMQHHAEHESNAAMDLFEHITPFHVNRSSKEMGLAIVRDEEVASKNLQEFMNKYDGKFSRWWTEHQGRNLQELSPTLEA